MSASSWYSRVWSTAGGSLDRLYAGVIHSIGSAKFFRNGWGDISLLCPDKFYRALVSVQLGPTAMEVSWKPVQTGVHRGKPFQVFEGTFESPAASGVSNLPLCCLDGRVWLMRPGEATHGPTGMSACVIQLAATGEHGPERRQVLAKSLLPQGIGTLVLEGPYYGNRKPRGQLGSKLCHVADLIKLGATTILESVCLIRMLHAAGVKKVCVAGWSMGGVHACMVAAFSRVPVACAAMLPPRSAAAAYSDGALSEFVHFPALRSARDATGAPVLPAVLRMLRMQPPYPNTPILLEPRAPPWLAPAHAEPAGARDTCAAIADGGRPDGTDSAELGGALGPADMHEPVAGLYGARHIPRGKDVEEMFREQGDLHTYGGKVGGGGVPASVTEGFLPPLETPHRSFEASEAGAPQHVSASLLRHLPVVPLTPHLHRFLTALRQLQLPLLRRGKASARKAGRSRRAVPRARLPPPRPPALPPNLTYAAAELASPQTSGTSARPEAQKRASKQGGRGPAAVEEQALNRTATAEVAAAPAGEGGAAGDAAAAADVPPFTGRLPPPLRSAGGLLQRLSSLSAWGMHASRRTAGRTGRPVQRFRPHTPKPPSVVLRRNLAPDAFRATLEDLLVAELELMHKIRPHMPSKPHPSRRIPSSGRTAPHTTQRAALRRHPRPPLKVHAAHAGAPLLHPARAGKPSSIAHYIFGSSALSRQTSAPGVARDDSPPHRDPTAADRPTLQHMGPIDSSAQVDSLTQAACEDARHAIDSPVAPSADISELPPVAAYRRAIERSLGDMVGTVTAPLRRGGQTYTRLLRRVISGGEMLGPVDDAELGGDGAEAAEDAAPAGARHPGAEALLALTLEAFTDLCRYPRPLAPHAAVLVAARDDAYVAVQSTEAIAARWPGAELWHAEGGHVSSFLLLNPLYLKAVTHALHKLDAGPPQRMHVDGADAHTRMVLPGASVGPPGAGERSRVSWGG